MNNTRWMSKREAWASLWSMSQAPFTSYQRIGPLGPPGMGLQLYDFNMIITTPATSFCWEPSPALRVPSPSILRGII